MPVIGFHRKMPIRTGVFAAVLYAALYSQKPKRVGARSSRYQPNGRPLMRFLGRGVGIEPHRRSRPGRDACLGPWDRAGHISKVMILTHQRPPVDGRRLPERPRYAGFVRRVLFARNARGVPADRYRGGPISSTIATAKQGVADRHRFASSANAPLDARARQSRSSVIHLGRAPAVTRGFLFAPGLLVRL
jgi:hypothetical protein